MAFNIKQGDRKPLFVVALRDDFGEETESAVNLTTAGSVVFNMREIGGGAVKITRGSATVTNAVNGEVTYSWQTADTNEAGSYEAEVEVVWPGNLSETFPNGSDFWQVDINDDIA